MTSRVPLSVLDLVPVSQGMSRTDAFVASRELAKLADSLGYQRYWVAEHHGSDTFMASATSLVLGDLATRTTGIRLGSGGVMLPNHAPLMVAEYYGTLATMYGDRFDLGLGRAPGTDPMTAAALRRNHGELDTFARDVLDLQHYLGEGHASGVRAVPGEGTDVPMWMLGSSTGGAQVAAALGLPFSFASHFAPQQMEQAIALYRSAFRADAPTAQVERPTVMAGANVLIADTHEEAVREFTTSQLMRVRIRTGQLAPLDPPADRIEDVIPTEALDLAGRPDGPATFVGTAEEVTEGLTGFVERHGLDEVIVATYTFEPKVRQASYAALARAWGLTGR
ncbi:LLM class flavin-dependent oxidoreductase [Calidifontibacter sp. DB0510]|uniref:LLM class flavin-dependent oxidoreductase n=1 Tax=Metallococcus carri TaxID=1656884 RepID=A0A967B000_9MICO|nr:LLM class flavin-dependent oxidoreductase [Metallococcus carri]NHN54730.1 LLM class flavin-dependent oxidoreductase [Metallococcus carri]NOP37075.1 LLM class flavin-dependent oxidoreductase [Calidifontibacter sp. DB2511S]